jgi:hypothetical protein
MGDERDEEETMNEFNFSIDSEEDFVRLIAENMAIYAETYRHLRDGEPPQLPPLKVSVDRDVEFIPQARELLRSFKEIEGHLPDDFVELEAWAGYVRWKASLARYS